MSSFELEKKREHADLADKALAKGDLELASFHFAKVANFALTLADRTEDRIRASYVKEARELLDLSDKLEVKAKEKASEPKEKVTPEDTEEQPTKFQALTDRPEVELDDVAGLEEIKALVREDVIMPFQHPELPDRFGLRRGAGVLLYGPPGNGKTFVAKAIAGEVDAPFFNVRGSELKSKYVGDTEKNISELFAQVRSHERCVLFLDECESILRDRGRQKIASVEQFLAETDGVQQSNTCLLLLLATNRPWMIDSAVMRANRIGIKIHVGLPDQKAREEIIRLAMKKAPMAEDVDIEAIAQAAEGYSGADLGAEGRGSVCTEAKHLAYRRQLELVASALEDGRDKPALTEIVQQEDFDQAMRKVKPSVSKNIIEKLKAWDSDESDPGDDSEDE